MIQLEYRRDERWAWRTLSYSNDSSHCTDHIVAWTKVLQGGSFRYNEVDMPVDLMASLGKLKAKQEAKDAQENARKADRLLDTLEENGVMIWVNDDGNLSVKGTLTDEMRAGIKALKPDLLALLKGRPQWDDAEANEWERKIMQAHDLVKHHYHPIPGSWADDVFAEAARNIFADWFAAFLRCKQCKRMDVVRRRADGLLGWMATLDKTIEELRAPRNNYMIQRPKE